MSVHRDSVLGVEVGDGGRSNNAIAGEAISAMGEVQRAVSTIPQICGRR